MKYIKLDDAAKIVKQYGSLATIGDEKTIEEFVIPDILTTITIPTIEASEDCISRQAVMDMLDHMGLSDEALEDFGTEDDTYISKYDAIDNISDMPSVLPTQRECNDAISRSEVASYIDHLSNCRTGKGKSLEYLRKFVEKCDAVSHAKPTPCKDCKHYEQKTEHTGKCNFGDAGVGFNDYCSMANQQPIEGL